jgi:hypothetical protein
MMDAGWLAPAASARSARAELLLLPTFFEMKPKAKKISSRKQHHTKSMNGSPTENKQLSCSQGHMFHESRKSAHRLSTGSPF